MFRTRKVFLGLAAVVALAALTVGCTTSAAEPTATPTSSPGVGVVGAGPPLPPGGLLDSLGTRLGESVAASLYSAGGQQAGIWVNGEGTVTAEPDLAVLSLGVETLADTVSVARQQAAEAMSRIMDAMRGEGIAEKDIQTRYFNIQPEYTYDDFRKRQVLTGYRVTNTVTVKVRALNTMGAVIDGSVAAGGNAIRINGVQFTIEDPSTLRTQAREAAVRDALAKAQQFASLTGVQLGRLLFISESGGAVPVPYLAGRAFSLEAAKDVATPISTGELDVRVNVQAVFDIL